MEGYTIEAGQKVCSRNLTLEGYSMADGWQECVEAIKKDYGKVD